MRDTLIIAAACVLAIIVGGALFLSGTTTPAAGAVAFSTYTSGDNSGDITERKNYQITTEEELAQLWEMIYGIDAPTMPVVDFTREELLAIFDGTHSSGGYDVQVLTVEDEPGVERRIAIRHSAPGASCITSQAIVSPFIIVKVPSTILPLARTDIEETLECD